MVEMIIDRNQIKKTRFLTSDSRIGTLTQKLNTSEENRKLQQELFAGSHKYLVSKVVYKFKIKKYCTKLTR